MTRPTSAIELRSAVRHIRSSDDGALAPRLLGAAGRAAPHRPARRTAVCAGCAVRGRRVCAVVGLGGRGELPSQRGIGRSLSGVTSAAGRHRHHLLGGCGGGAPRLMTRATASRERRVIGGITTLSASPLSSFFFPRIDLARCAFLLQAAARSDSSSIPALRCECCCSLV